MYSPGACSLRAGIYVPGSHVLFFAIPGPSMYSPEASTPRVVIYFPGSHVLLFGMIKKNSGLSMYSPGGHLLSGQPCTLIWHD